MSTDKGWHCLSESDERSDVGDAEPYNVVVKEPDLDSLNNIKLVELNWRVPETVSCVLWNSR